MSECEHEFTMIDLRGHWHCSKCGIVEIVYLRTRAEAAEKERDEWIAAFRKQVAEDGHTIETLDQDNQRLMQENAQLKDENLAMRNCQNCAGSSLCVGGDCNHDDDECLQYGTHEKWRYE